MSCGLTIFCSLLGGFLLCLILSMIISLFIGDEPSIKFVKVYRKSKKQRTDDLEKYKIECEYEFKYILSRILDLQCKIMNKEKKK